jgi:cellulose synthase/poly-beta-1,6-N-acetylglucosamine synthase-like glycosyltransferase/peptidoglycan/xylan/chitin deacetylase (PgdA/CDA1 family)/spore germination protein YaaH
MLGKPVFFDPTGKRARFLRAAAWTVGTLSAVIFVLFAAILLVVHTPEEDKSFDRQLSAHTSIRCAWAPTCSPAHAVFDANAVAPELLKAASKLASDLREKERALRTRHPQAEVVNRRPLPAPLRGSTDRALSIGFYVNWDDNSYPALKRALPHLDWVVPSWMSLEGKDLTLNADIDDRVLKLVQETKPDTPILPMIQNAVEGKWNGAGLARLLADPAARAARIDDIVSFLQANKFQGLTVDFEEVPPSAQNDLKDFLTELSGALTAHGLALVLAVPFDDDSWPYASYATIADYLLLMGYDQHWDQSSPGSIAGEDWFETILDKRMQTLDPDRTIVALGGYGYDWIKGHQTQELTFEEAVLSAKDSEADIEFDPKSANPHFSFIEDDGNRHDVWFLDGVTAYNEIEAGDAYRMAGYALWRIGSEDPSVWSVFGQPYGAPPPQGLREIGTSQDIDFEGNGEVLHVRELPEPGKRAFDIDHDTGQIVDETYKAVPTPFVIERTGSAPGKLALTFDDGPDPDWTPQILNILKQKHVHASFFIIGENAQANPDLVRRILAAGHDIGNHTYTHPNLGDLPASLVRLEINANQRLFEALTGRSMRLFRAPFLGDAEPTTSDEIVPIGIAQSMGYVTVGLHVDPNDWLHPPADDIVNRVIAQVTDPNPEVSGHIVLLHDSGGDRSQTVAALPRLIDALRSKGYEFVTVSELAGLTRDQAMPPLPPLSYAQLFSLPVFMTLSWLGRVLTGLFVLAICLGVARVLFLTAAGLGNRRAEQRRVPPRLPEPAPLVTVLIPAFNEMKVIVGAVRHILASSYANLEVIVIDDGSTDGTSEQVRTHFAGDGRVRLFRVQNGGKAAALNTGLRAARGEVVVALDADTHFETDAIAKLVRWFADESVGAVAGNAKVGNRVNMITRWQALEYVTSQNLERRALAALGCITVVPGAIGAWRREALARLGGFPSDTLAEDQDLTLSLLIGGYKVLYDSSAIGWTEAPDTLSGLIKQRFRWAFGTLQCLWKHRQVTLRPHHGTLGLIAIPQTWLFQFLLTAIAPIVDLALIWQIITATLQLMQHQDQYDPDTLRKVVAYYVIFLVIDLGSATVALLMERREKWRLVPLLVLQRFGYRQLMYWVVLKALATAAIGPLVGWGKLERKATVGATA